jgi:hypothetical protein
MLTTAGIRALMYLDPEIRASISPGKKLVSGGEGGTALGKGAQERRTAAEVEEGVEVADSGFQVCVKLFAVDVLHRSGRHDCWLYWGPSVSLVMLCVSVYGGGFQGMAILWSMTPLGLLQSGVVNMHNVQPEIWGMDMPDIMGISWVLSNNVII